MNTKRKAAIHLSLVNAFVPVFTPALAQTGNTASTGRSRPLAAGCAASASAAASVTWFAKHLIMAALFFISALAYGGEPGESPGGFVITVTANNLYLCGIGHGGIYGCIDEARSREMTAITIMASHAATTEAVQELLNAVHTTGFEVELGTLYEPAT